MCWLLSLLILLLSLLLVSAGLRHWGPPLSQHFTHQVGLALFLPINSPSSLHRIYHRKSSHQCKCMLALPDMSPHDMMSGLLRCHVGGGEQRQTRRSSPHRTPCISPAHQLRMKATSRQLSFLLPGKPSETDDKRHSRCLGGGAHARSALWPDSSLAQGSFYASRNWALSPPASLTHIVPSSILSVSYILS